MRRTASPIQSLPRRALRVPSQVRATGGLRVWLFYLPGPGPRLMSWLRKRRVLFRNPHAAIEFRGPVYLGPGFSLHMPQGGTFIVGPGSSFAARVIDYFGPPGQEPAELLEQSASADPTG